MDRQAGLALACPRVLGAVAGAQDAYGDGAESQLPFVRDEAVFVSYR